MVKRIAAALTVLILIPAAALAGLVWREDTPAMSMLKTYTENVNRLLTETGEQPVNSIFANFPTETVMGITAEDNAEIPEDVEITVAMSYDNLLTLQLRVSNASRFPRIAAAMIRALYGDGMSAEEALAIPQARAERALNEPQTSFTEEVDDLQGTVPRVYYAYEPNRYHDGVNWLQMTLIFPMVGAWDGNGLVIGTEEEGKHRQDEDADPDYEGYYSQDDYQHLEFFVTPTPEPDSAAAEYDFR